MLENQDRNESLIEDKDIPKRSNSVRYNSEDKIIIDLQTIIIRHENPIPDIFQTPINELDISHENTVEQDPEPVPE